MSTADAEKRRQRGDGDRIGLDFCHINMRSYDHLVIYVNNGYNTRSDRR
jgi:hypothetical protein